MRVLGTRWDSQGLARACKTLRLKHPELPWKQHVLPSLRGQQKDFGALSQPWFYSVIPTKQPHVEQGAPAAGPPP